MKVNICECVSVSASREIHSRESCPNRKRDLTVNRLERGTQSTRSKQIDKGTGGEQDKNGQSVRESARGRENQRMSTTTDLQVLNYFDLLMTTSARDSE